jgi:hypothetical protein
MNLVRTSLDTFLQGLSGRRPWERLVDSKRFWHWPLRCLNSKELPQWRASQLVCTHLLAGVKYPHLRIIVELNIRPEVDRSLTYRICVTMVGVCCQVHWEFRAKELVNGWNWRTSFWVRLAWPKRPKIVCSPSYVDIRLDQRQTQQGDWSMSTW